MVALLKERIFSKHHVIFLWDVKAGSVMAPSILWGTSRMQHCTHFQSYLTVSHSQQVSGKFYMSSEGTAVELAVTHTVSNSIKVSDRITLIYYLHWVWVAQSGSAVAAITSSKEGPQESDLPAAAARSSLLSAPITGASVPTKTNSVVQPSVQPLPLPELLPSSPEKSHKLNVHNKFCHIKYSSNAQKVVMHDAKCIIGIIKAFPKQTENV